MRLAGNFAGDAGRNAVEIVLNAIAVVFEDALPLDVEHAKDAFFHDSG